MGADYAGTSVRLLRPLHQTVGRDETIKEWLAWGGSTRARSRALDDGDCDWAAGVVLCVRRRADRDAGLCDLIAAL